MMKRRLISAALFALIASPMAMPTLAYAGSTSAVAITSIDSTSRDNVKVRALIDDPSNTSSYSFQLTENGTAKNATGTRVTDAIGYGQVTRRTVIVADTSSVLARDGRFDKQKAAMKDVVSQFQLNDQAMLLAAGNEVVRSGRFSSNFEDLNARIDAMQQTSGRALNGAINSGIEALKASNADVKNLVIFAAGPGTDAAPADLATRIVGLNINTFVGGIKISGVSDPSSLQALIQPGHGAFRTANSADDVIKLGTSIGSAMNNEWVVSYSSSAEDVMKVALSVDGHQALATTRAGNISSGRDLHAVYESPAIWDRALSKVPMPDPSIVRLLVSALVMVAAGIVAYLTWQVFDRRSGLEAALRPYSDKRIDPDEDTELHIDTALMRRAVEATEQMARDRGFLTKVEDRLFQANLSVNAGEFIFLLIAAGLVLGLLGAVTRGLFGAVLGIAVGSGGAWSYVSFMGGRRKRAFEKQLPDSLQLLAGSLRAGYSLPQGLDATAEQVDDPMANELKIALAEARLGRPIEEALEEMSERVQSLDFKWTVLAIAIQREIGGNLAELLDNVSNTMIERERLRREINALTAEGRLSAIILVLLPIGMALYLYVTNPNYVGILIHDSFGRLIGLMGVAFMAFGSWWMKQMLKLDL